MRLLRTAIKSPVLEFQRYFRLPQGCPCQSPQGLIADHSGRRQSYFWGQTCWKWLVIWLFAIAQVKSLLMSGICQVVQLRRGLRALHGAPGHMRLGRTLKACLCPQRFEYINIYPVTDWLFKVCSEEYRKGTKEDHSSLGKSISQRNDHLNLWEYSSNHSKPDFCMRRMSAYTSKYREIPHRHAKDLQQQNSHLLHLSAIKIRM